MNDKSNTPASDNASIGDLQNDLNICISNLHQMIQQAPEGQEAPIANCMERLQDKMSDLLQKQIAATTPEFEAALAKAKEASAKTKAAVEKFETIAAALKAVNELIKVLASVLALAA